MQRCYPPELIINISKNNVWGLRMTHHEEKKEKKEKTEAKVEPIKPGDKRVSKKRLLDTCE